MQDKPRSAHQFKSIPSGAFEAHPAFPGPFKATHKRISTGLPVEVLARNIFTWPTAYPQVLYRNSLGTVFTESEEVFDAVKRKKFVNYEPLE